MSGDKMAYLYYYGFWLMGIICCAAAAFGIFIVIRAIFFPPKD